MTQWGADLDGLRAEVAAMIREFGRIPPDEAERLLEKYRYRGHDDAWLWAEVGRTIDGDADLAAIRRFVTTIKNRAQLLHGDFDVDAEVEKSRERAEALGWSERKLRRIIVDVQREVRSSEPPSTAGSRPEPWSERVLASWRSNQWARLGGVSMAVVLVVVIGFSVLTSLDSPSDGAVSVGELPGRAGEAELLLRDLEAVAAFDSAVYEEALRLRQRLSRASGDRDTGEVGPAQISLIRRALREAEPRVWRTVSRDASVDALTRFLSAYPDGRFAAEAESRLERLREAVQRREILTAVQGELVRLGRDVGVTGVLDAATREALTRFGQSTGRNGMPEIEAALIRDLESYAHWPYRVGEAFSDCDVCPDMVVIAGGGFRMGSPPDQEGAESNEQPVHPVEVPRFALGRTEVTFDEWRACVDDGGCDFMPADEGWGTGRRPVVNVSWGDALAYLRWLSRRTGRDYRLPTEAEWEYAVRAGSGTRFHTGPCITSAQANFDGRRPIGDCPQSGAVQRTMPVASYPENAFGLFDMHGNVREWTRDCWNDNYLGAPSDGSAWLTGDCSRPVIRGGSWRGSERAARSANRTRPSGSFTDAQTGFRAALDLEQGPRVGDPSP
jgi:serine/threonine-protein kinase